MTEAKKPSKLQRAGEVVRQDGVWGFCRRFVEYCYYNPVLVLGRDWSGRQAERRHIAAIVKSGLARSLDDLELDRSRQSDTLFILGGGRTVNDLTADDWRHIGSCDSVGLNFWLIHDFVPTYYFFEAGNDPAGQRDEVMRKLIDRKADLYREVVFVCNHHHWTLRGKGLDDIPAGARANLHLHAPFHFPITSRMLLKLSLALWRPSERGLQKGGPNRLGSMIHHRGSLSAAVTFGVLAGYRKIVTVGIDLNDRTYFWEAAPERYAHLPRPAADASGGVHFTAVEGAGAPQGLLPIDQFLELLDECIFQRLGIELLVSSSKSRLHPRFPIYQKFAQTEGPAPGHGE